MEETEKSRPILNWTKAYWRWLLGVPFLIMFVLYHIRLEYVAQVGRGLVADIEAATEGRDCVKLSKSMCEMFQRNGRALRSSFEGSYTVEKWVRPFACGEYGTFSVTIAGSAGKCSCQFFYNVERDPPFRAREEFMIWHCVPGELENRIMEAHYQ